MVGDPTAMDGVPLRVVYLRARWSGMTHEEAGRIVAFLAGIGLPGAGGMPNWTTEEVKYLVFLRATRKHWMDGPDGETS